MMMMMMMPTPMANKKILIIAHAGDTNHDNHESPLHHHIEHKLLAHAVVVHDDVVCALQQHGVALK